MNAPQTTPIPTASPTATAANPLDTAPYRLLRLAMEHLGPVVPGVAARVAERLYYRPRRHGTPARERSVLARADRSRVKTSVGRLALYTWEADDGTAVFPWEARRTVLLVHGWEGRATQLHAFVEPLLARGFRVIGLDAPAHGRSPGVEIDVDSYAQALCEVVDAVGPVDAVIAHSMGGASTLAALQNALELQAVVLVGSPSTFSWVVDSFVSLAHLPRAVSEAFLARVEARQGADVWDRLHATALAQNSVRALIVHDDDDHEVSVQHAETLAAEWPHAELLRTQGLGHRRVLRDPAVVEAVVTFLDAIECKPAHVRAA
jgi:pimeloyl-ACP methyl ester carboxylesterase